MSDDRGSDWVKVVVALEQDEDDYPPATYENLWARPVEAKLYKIDNIPFFAMGISLESKDTLNPHAGRDISPFHTRRKRVRSHRGTSGQDGAI